MHFGERFSIDVPACDACRRKMSRQWWSRMVVDLILITVAAVIASSLLRSHRGLFKHWYRVWLTVILLLPFLLWRTLYPPPINATAYSTTVDYEFLDPNYAHAFADLNGVEVNEL